MWSCWDRGDDDGSRQSCAGEKIHLPLILARIPYWIKHAQRQQRGTVCKLRWAQLSVVTRMSCVRVRAGRTGAPVNNGWRLSGPAVCFTLSQYELPGMLLGRQMIYRERSLWNELSLRKLPRSVGLRLIASIGVPAGLETATVVPSAIDLHCSGKERIK